MRIPSFTSTVAVNTTVQERSHKTSLDQKALRKPDSAPDVVGKSLSNSLSSAVIDLSALSRPLKPQINAGASMNAINSLIQTSSKMNLIRNDPTLPEQAKRMMLKPLAQANRNALSIIDAKAERDKKSQIIEASNNDADEIRQTGEEIAASDETTDTSQVISPNSLSPETTEEIKSANKTVAANSAPQVPAAAPSYSTTQSRTTTGTNIDTQA